VPTATITVPNFMSRKPSVVAVVASGEDLEELSKLPPGSADLCELRIDLLQNCSADLDALIADLSIPKIVTVRDPREGGANQLSAEARLKLFYQWLPVCDYIDIECRNLSEFSRLVRDAEQRGKGIIYSFHDFEKTPEVSQMEELFKTMEPKANQIFKIATEVSTWQDVEKLILFMRMNHEHNVAAMGMGPFGKLSRLILARLGSVLVYAAVGRKIVAAQWEVTALQSILAKL
jgi:3-dehydroquinate dehydratase I